MTHGPASFQLISTNRKTSHVTHEPLDERKSKAWRRPISHPPFVCSTYVSVSATCPSDCVFKDNGCYVQVGVTKNLIRKLDRAAAFQELDADDVIKAEVDLIDSVFPKGAPQDGYQGGRDLRLHVGGDVQTERGAAMLAGAAERWRKRGGGQVWTYTHSWRAIRPELFGDISVLASVETVADADLAFEYGYVPAITVRAFDKPTTFDLPGSEIGLRVLPCSALTWHSNCVACRNCLRTDTVAMNKRPLAIGFIPHGMYRVRAFSALPDLHQVELFTAIDGGGKRTPRRGKLRRVS